MGRTIHKSCVALIGLLAFGALSMSAASQEPASFAGALQELDGDHDRSVAAVQELQAGGESAAIAIRDVWPALSRRAQRRALVALASLAGDHRAAVQCLAEAARSPDEQVREGAFNALRRAGPAGWQGLVTLLVDPDTGDRAAVLLARTEPDAALVPLLAVLTTEGGDRRPVLRRALATAVQRADESAEPKLRAWLKTEPSASAVASSALALASIDEYAPVVAAFIEYAAPRSSDFPTTWRLLQSAGAGGTNELVDRWVASQIQTPEAWMLRQAAVDAIAARGRRTEARVALEDPYPRVRARAARVLSKDPGSMKARATLARQDPWPMVRAEAITSLRSEPETTPVIVAAIDDPMSEVRTAAIEVLTRVSHDQGWARIHAHLRNRNEWPPVIAAAIGYAMEHCRTDATEALFGVIRRVTSPSALTDDINNAAHAVVALRALDTPEADAAILQIRRSTGLPATLQMALEEPLPKHRRCVPVGP